jgi:hypothetical protein
MLAAWTVMSASTGDDNASNQSAAAPTRHIGPLIDAMLQLEEALYALGIHVVGD